MTVRYNRRQANPKNFEELKRYINDEFRRIEEALRFPDSETVTIIKLHSAPEKPIEGMMVYADGTDWDPGSGAGIYQYRSASWTFIA